MIRKYLIPILAAAGVAFAAWMVIKQAQPVPAAQPVAAPSQAPFAAYVAGAGIIEAATENVAIGTHVAGVVTHVYVKPGSRVKTGDPLFKLDDRRLTAELGMRQTALQVAKAQLARLEQQPRAEEIPPTEARVQEAEAALADLKSQLSLWESVADQRAVSQDELSRRRYAVQAAQARLVQARTALDLLKAGSWKPDTEIVRAQVAAAEAQVEATRTDIELLTVRALVDGTVLQVKVRPGEFAQNGVLETPLVTLGNVEPLHVRVDVDENDAWRIHFDSPAMAFVRGNRDLKTPLKFVWVEPYVIPKKSLTGDSTERVDTRVLQLVYSFDRRDLPVYVGQQMDVFIQAPPN